MNKKYILTCTRDFDDIIKKQRPFKTREFLLYKRNFEKVKFGITVPKKLGNAVVRNKTKRRIKEIVRTNKIFFNFPGEYIIIVREPVLSQDFLEIKKSLIYAFKKISEDK
ncbi:MAG: ribonuclease P protein component [Bacilli bacterium]